MIQLLFSPFNYGRAMGVDETSRKAEFVYNGFKIGNNATEIAHHRFPNYTLFIRELSLDNIYAIKNNLRWFELIYGQEVNFL